VESLAEDGYDPKIVFTTRGTPSDHTYQLLKEFMVHHLTKLCFRSTDPGYTDRLAGHIDRTGYDFVVVNQSVFQGTDVQPVVMKNVYGMLEHKPRLIFVGSQCSPSVSQAAADLAEFNPRWTAVSQNVATRFMGDYDVQVVYGPAVMPEASGVDIRAEFGINPGAKVLGYIGDVDMVNWEPVIEAAKRMRCGLVIAGTGDRVSQLLEVKGNVRVVPMIPQKLRGDWYRAFDCFIYPVRASGFPMLPLEAALAGCPVAMTPVSDAYQLLQDNFGFFAPRPEEIIKAVQEAVGKDKEHNKREIRERFSRESFLSGWHVLLADT
jgi:glycosyltransferase involved in cell wall biosynthesis